MLTHEDDIDRDHSRIKQTGEVFTPPELVSKMLDELDIDWDNIPQDKTFLDPTAGNGNFLEALAKRGVPLHNIYGVDIMPDNVLLIKKRLLDIVGHTDENRAIVDNNIRCEDALTYDYAFK